MIVRIALLLVSLPLLAHGAEGLYRAWHAASARSPLIPAVECVVGAQVLLVWLFLSIKSRRRKSKEAAETRSTAASAGADASDAAGRITSAIRQPTPEFRRLMLVNLPPNAALSALEQAPPLGAQPAVRSALARVLPGIKFNDHGLGQFNGADHSILMDLGMAPQVWAATIDVTGDASAAALRRLITQTGWRAYAPRLGRFITADDLPVPPSSPIPPSIT
jgi:hypothetical protein